eukprot:GEMP01027272.1.p1 GENE.GEMP01027272.1~~GEMP01027272.1.p1  ORF type:complete len:356 (+),score=78.24 GEMP01027272.1:124-1191(+)
MDSTVHYVEMLVRSPRRFFTEQLEVERMLEQKFLTIDMNAAIERHPNLTNGMRWILVNWLNQTVDYHRKSRQTFWLAVTLMDTFLTKVTHEIPVSKFQMLGAIFYWIAAKNEHGSDSPQVQDIVQLLGNMSQEQMEQTETDILGGECMVLNIVCFDVIYPSAASLLDHYFMHCYRADQVGQYDMCCFLLDETTLDIRYNAFSPSERASGAIYASRLLAGEADPWDDSIAKITKVPYNRALTCSQCMFNSILREGMSERSFVFRKYNHAALHRVSAVAWKRTKMLVANNRVPKLVSGAALDSPFSARHTKRLDAKMEIPRQHAPGRIQFPSDGGIDSLCDDKENIIQDKNKNKKGY